jgi:hypothetical protein
LRAHRGCHVVLLRSCLTVCFLFATSAAFAVPLPQARPAEKTQKADGDEARDSGTAKADGQTPAAVPVPEPRPGSVGAAPAEAKPTDTGDQPSPLDAGEPGKAEPSTPPDAAQTPQPEPRPKVVEEAVKPDLLCKALKDAGEAQFEELPAISEGACGAPFPIRLSAISPKGGERVVFDPPVVVRCATAQAAVDWLRDEVQPAARKSLGEPLAALRSTNGYACRGRNRTRGAKLSEHARANAIDIGMFETRSGKKIAVGSTDEPGLSFMLGIRAAACGPFKTVLGPGSDSYHATHFHLDTIKRGRNGNSTYCQ